MNSAFVVSVNVNPEGGVPKHPVDGAILGTGGVEGDRQNDLRYHGGPDRAVSIFSSERIQSLRGEGHPINPGSTGENITIGGLDWNEIGPGKIVLIGDARIEITAPAAPCATIKGCFLNEEFSRISEKRRPGWSRWYARVLDEARVSPNDSVTILE